MSRNLKALGLALLAVFAMSAIAAQGASATTHTFTSEAGTTDLVGDNVGAHTFESGSGSKVTCQDAKFTGTQTATEADQVEVTPSYADCKLGDVAVTIDVNSCKYLFESDTNDDGDAAVDLKCNHSGSITLTASGCTVHFSDTHTGGGDTVNQDLTGVSYTNDDGDLDTTDDITVDATVKETIKTEGTGLGCAALGLSGTKTNGSYTGKTTVTGKNADGNHVGIRICTP